ncbi:MAG TPA: hypothetical protein VMJ93_10865 [Verrucomicrobiae bacterium]|nr:hypothetical protein [Verrucomicrobiae bacterium]
MTNEQPILKTTFQVEPTLWKTIRKLAIENDTTAGALLRSALRDIVAQHKAANVQKALRSTAGKPTSKTSG